MEGYDECDGRYIIVDCEVAAASTAATPQLLLRADVDGDRCFVRRKKKRTAGKSPSERERPSEDSDLQTRNNKIVRKGEEGFSGTTGLAPRHEDWMEEPIKEGRNIRTYASIVIGKEQDQNPEIEDDEDEDADETDDDFSEMSNEERDENMEDNEAIPETEEDLGKEEHTRTKKDKADIFVEDMGEGLYNIIVKEKIKKELWKPW
ncbi:hypothetical protein PIB30_044736 [Stylosanthes scabra]|uniref:Uncharacterized protein n=1 Tax=Stylosanthes scabra TaxID=79078 RepID=A0ABU6XG88_9FABA|nr:hypothetical protein [Stylosanthes scabra]